MCIAHTSMKLKHKIFLLWKFYFRIISTMHLPLIAHTRVYQMYVTVVCTRLKRALHFIIVLSQLRTVTCTGWWHCGSITPKDGLPEWFKKVFRKWNTFLCYRVSQLRGSTRWLPFTTCIKPSVKRIVISVYLNSVFI